MITEDYVPFETAKLLKEKEFDVDCKMSYFDGSLVDYTMYGFCEGELINCPTLQMAMKWLREVHGIAVNICWGEIFEETYRWWCIVLNMKNGEILRDSSYYQTYEEAANAAILYTLENLV